MLEREGKVSERAGSTTDKALGDVPGLGLLLLDRVLLLLNLILLLLDRSLEVIGEPVGWGRERVSGRRRDLSVRGDD